MLVALCTCVQGCVSTAFEKADNYRQRFEPYREFYEENEAMDVDTLREEDHGQYTHNAATQRHQNLSLNAFIELRFICGLAG